MYTYLIPIKPGLGLHIDFPPLNPYIYRVLKAQDIDLVQGV